MQRYVGEEEIMRIGWRIVITLEKSMRERRREGTGKSDDGSVGYAANQGVGLVHRCRRFVIL